MKLISRLALFVVFATFATCASAQPSMPDFSKWNKAVDHATSYVLKGKPVQVRDVHYEFINKEQTEAFQVIVFYNPDTSKAWFSVLIHHSLNKDSEANLYETDKNGAWVFVEDISNGNLESVLSKYGLVEVVK